jgi:hypothetical protein
MCMERAAHREVAEGAFTVPTTPVGKSRNPRGCVAQLCQP